MKVYFACLPTPDQQRVLTKTGSKNRLISYFYLKENPAKVPGVLRMVHLRGTGVYYEDCALWPYRMVSETKFMRLKPE